MEHMHELRVVTHLVVGDHKQGKRLVPVERYHFIHNKSH